MCAAIATASVPGFWVQQVLLAPSCRCVCTYLATSPALRLSRICENVCGKAAPHQFQVSECSRLSRTDHVEPVATAGVQLLVLCAGRDFSIGLWGQK